MTNMIIGGACNLQIVLADAGAKAMGPLKIFLNLSSVKQKCNKSNAPIFFICL
jgi:hypothetical protein